ncbi:ATP synthase F1 subunit gamma [Conexibacter sp. DBS9H8]|uniref:ATP synthase F1 subunit gamma n=1 Tax=Conexibacter sp. DBS9H8 TaxID=2937801 RepID=UPI00200DDDD8|nr:ATP synthase F1 subunit gamma [Conexibacter sp. DBS9H8]
MAESQRDVKNRIASVKNIQTITRAMEMVAAARLRRAEERIALLAPYANGIRRMTRQAAAAAGTLPNLPILSERESVENVGLLLIAGDRGLAGAFNSQIVRAGVAAAREAEAGGVGAVFFASGKKPASSLRFRKFEPKASFEGFSDRPAYADAQRIAAAVIDAYVSGEVDRVEVIYNHFVSAVTQTVTRETLLPLQQASILDADGEGEEPGAAGGRIATAPEYEPGPDEILTRLVPDYVEVSIYRALLDSTASEHGARMSAMRNATDNAKTIIEDLTLAMNRARQAAITQEIMEVVAGAEGVA